MCDGHLSRTTLYVAIIDRRTVGRNGAANYIGSTYTFAVVLDVCKFASLYTGLTSSYLVPIGTEEALFLLRVNVT